MKKSGGILNIFKLLWQHKGLLIMILSFILFLPVIMGSSPTENGEHGDILKTGATPFIVGAVFIILYIVLLSNKVTPALVTMFGALLFVFIGFVSFDTATNAVDWNTLCLLSGMMIMVGILKYTGLFQYVAIKIVKLAKGNLILIWVGFCIITAIMSAFLDNVTTILIIAPITMLLTDTINLTPVPFLISEAICANIGGTATMIGDPPNILIGSASGLSFVDFILNLGPIALIVLISTVIIFYILYKKQFQHKINTKFDLSKVIKDKKLMTISVIIFGLTLIAFVMSHFFHLEPGPVALFGAMVLMIVGKQDSEHWFKEVEWDILFFFIGLFIMVKGLELQGILDAIGNLMINITNGDLLLLSILLIWVVGISASFLGAVPIVTTLIPIIFLVHKTLEAKTGAPVNIDVLWWSMSLGACLGGNGTIFGTATNMVAVTLTKKRKPEHRVTFMTFFKIGYPLMLISLVLCTIYIYIFYFLLK